MSFKDILALLLSVEEDEAAIAVAEHVAQAMEAKISALLVEVLPPSIYTVEGLLTAALADALVQERQEFARETARLNERIGKSASPMSARTVAAASDRLGRDIGAIARCADLSVLMSPHLSGRKYYRMPMFEGVLFGSGRPVLVVPPDWRPGAIGRNVIVAWNGAREAARALADAAPFLERADEITIVTMGPGADASEFDLKAANEAVAHLGRRGLVAKSHGVDNFGGDEGAALITEARVRQADLIVMGGYGNSRLGESIFGGVTREAIEFAPIPVLMSH